MIWKQIFSRNEADDIWWDSFLKISRLGLLKVCHKTFDDDIIPQMISSVYDLDNIWTLDKNVPKSSSFQPFFLPEFDLQRFPIGAFPLAWHIVPKKFPSLFQGTKGFKLENMTLDQRCFQRKILIKRGKHKINKQKPQPNWGGRPERAAPRSCHNSRNQQEEERLFFFPVMDSVDEKSCTPQFFCLHSVKVFSVLCSIGTCTRHNIAVNPELQFSVDPK